VNDNDGREAMGDTKALARAEALDIIEDFKAGDDPDQIERAADGLLRSLKRYDQGPDFGREVIRQLRLIAKERRQRTG